MKHTQIHGCLYMYTHTRFCIHPMYSSILPCKPENGLNTSGKTSKLLAAAVASGTEEWEARGPVREKLFLNFLLYILFVDGISGTQKEQDLVCWNMELERGGHSLRPPNLVVSRHHWGVERVSPACSIIRRELQGCRLHVGIDLRDYRVFISSSFCKAHFYELVQPAVEHYIHHIDRKFQGLGTKILYGS